MFKKCILILAASCMMYSCATQTESNPFLTEFQTPNGVPPFDKIKLEHYEPAFQKGIEEQNANIQAIIDNTEAPTFENVIVALDNSSPTLDRVGGVFFNLTEAETTDELTALSMKLAPTLAEHEDHISLNQELFKKVDAVYSQKDALGLTREQQRLLEKTHKKFIRSGANLPADKQACLREINKQLSTLGITFSNNILNDRKANGCLPSIMQAACLSSNTPPTGRYANRCTRPTSTAAITMTRTTTRKSLPTSYA